MKQKALLLNCLLLLLTALTSVQAAQMPYLHTQGQDIVDAQGRKVLLRGVGLGNWLLPEGYMWKFGPDGDRPRNIERLVSALIGPDNASRFWTEFRHQYITESDIKRISELGFNSVRPALNARLLLAEGENPTYIEEGFELLDNLVSWCKRHNLYIILDMHAAPGGQTGQNIDDSIDDEPRLFSEPKNQDLLVQLWVKLATRYKDEPTVAAYDLLNEPLPERTGAAARYKAQLEPLYKRITKAIREVDKKHMITLEGADWSNDWSVFGTKFDSNLFYQFHYYAWDQPDNLKGINQFLAYREKLKAPAWVGETGEKDNPIYWGTTDLFEAHNIGWSFWPWKKMETVNTPCSIKAPGNWDQIVAYSHAKAKPSKEVAQKAFDQLLKNIRFENCVFFPNVVNAMLRHIPGKVEAENYGQAGPSNSYWIKNTSQKSKYYRTSEPVPIEPVGTGEPRWSSEQAIKLTSEEWTTYTANSLNPKTCNITVRAKAVQTPATFEFSLNDKRLEVTVTGSDWMDLKLKPDNLSQNNRFKLLVKQGTILFDWIKFE